MGAPTPTVHIPATLASERGAAPHIVSGEVENHDGYSLDAFVNPDTDSPVAALMVGMNRIGPNGSVMCVHLIPRPNRSGEMHALLKSMGHEHLSAEGISEDMQKKFAALGVQTTNWRHPDRSGVDFSSIFAVDRRDEETPEDQRFSAQFKMHLEELRDGPLLGNNPDIRKAIIQAMGNRHITIYEAARDVPGITKGNA